MSCHCIPKDLKIIHHKRKKFHPSYSNGAHFCPITWSRNLLSCRGLMRRFDKPLHCLSDSYISQVIIAFRVITVHIRLVFHQYSSQYHRSNVGISQIMLRFRHHTTNSQRDMTVKQTTIKHNELKVTFHKRL